MNTPDTVAEGGATQHLFDWLFLDLNSFFASVEQQENPRYRRRPLAVVPVDTDHTCVIAASYEAKALGITTGTPVLEARRRCPKIIRVLARHDKYAEYHHRIIAAVDRHLPVHVVASIDEMACPLTGRWREPERAAEMARQIKAAIATEVGVCLRSSIGISTNRFLAKVATDMQKPDGLVLLHPTELPGRWEGMGLRDLPGIGKQMERRLNAAGIFSISALFACNARRLRRAWGSIEGERFWHSLRGEQLPEVLTKTSCFGHSQVLPPEDRGWERAEAVARWLLVRAAFRMRRGGYAASGVVVSVRNEGWERHAMEAKVSPTAESLDLVRAFTSLWSHLGEECSRAKLRKVSVVLHGLVPLSAPEQMEFSFDSTTGPSAVRKGLGVGHSLSQALDKIRRRYGAGAIAIGEPAVEKGGTGGAKIAFTCVPEAEDF